MEFFATFTFNYNQGNERKYQDLRVDFFDEDFSAEQVNRMAEVMLSNITKRPGILELYKKTFSKEDNTWYLAYDNSQNDHVGVNITANTGCGKD